MRLIDTHCHFDDAVFDADRATILQSMQQLGVSDVVVPAVTAGRWNQLTHVCTQASNIHAAYGLHPLFLQEHEEHDLSALEQRLRTESAVAVGECGLDYFLPELEAEQQMTFFVAQLELAKQFDLPVIIHARRAVDQVTKQIRRVGGLRGVVHSFAGSQQQAEQLFKLNFCLGIGGTVTYERAQRLQRVVANMPVEALLLETDAPDQPDSEWRGQRNTPLRLPVIATAVATVRNESVASLAAATTANAQRLFELV